MGYGFCVVCMFGIIGKTNPPNSSVSGFGHGLIRAPYFLGETAFIVAIPFLSLVPAVSLAFRYAYRTFNHSESKTLLNFVMLLVAVLVAILNACLYRGD